jgi:hypothetical protein
MMDKLSQYKSKLASRYIPIGLDAVGLKMLQSDVMFLSVKQDGHLAFLVCDGKSCSLQNASGKEWDGLPLLDEANSKLKGKSCTIAGELHVNSESRTYGFAVPSALSSAPETLAFAAFDVIDGEGVSDVSSWEEKFEALQGWLGGDGMVRAIVQEKVDSRSAIAPFYAEHVVDSGAEGVVVRHEYGPTYKIKPSIDLDLVVLGYCEGFGDDTGGVRELLLGLVADDGAFQIIAQVGNGMTQSERKSLFETVSKSKAESDYLEVSGKNVAFTMIPPEHVVQVRCIDVLSETSKGPIQRAMLKWDGKAYSFVAPNAAVSLVSAVFEGIRSDKAANTKDVGFAQITRWMDKMKGEVVNEELAASTVIRREVYVKEAKGIKSVRKFLAWKTNKEQTGSWPAYVFSLTDYSPKRKDALKKSLAIANTEEEALQLFESELADKVKKGWQPA